MSHSGTLSPLMVAAYLAPEGCLRKWIYMLERAAESEN